MIYVSLTRNERRDEKGTYKIMLCYLKYILNRLLFKFSKQTTEPCYYAARYKKNIILIVIFQLESNKLKRQIKN